MPIRLPTVARTAIAAACLMGAAATPLSAQEAMTDEERAAIEGVVRDYLLANPDLVVEALNLYQARQEELEAERQMAQVVANRDELLFSPTSPVLGNPEGDVTLVEFFDYQCGYCKRVLDDVFDAVEDDPDLRVVFKEFPILGPASMTAAQAALASRAQGLYDELHYALMEHRGQLSDDLIFAIAADVGLDVDQLRIDMQSDEVMGEIRANHALATAIGINGTPAFVIGNEVVPGAVGRDVLEDLIASARGS